jgi:hypothetical protein
VIVNGCPNGSLLSATTRDRWGQTANIESGLEETGPEDHFRESHAASQTCERDEASSEP